MDMIDSTYLTAFFRRASDRLEEERKHLCALDGEIGDGDHGSSMASGFAAISAALQADHDQNLPPDALLRRAAQAYLGEVGATVGPLYATAMLNSTKLFADGPLQLTDLPRLIAAFAEGIAARGRARIGDKTMLDAWYPALRAAEASAAADKTGLEIALAASAAADRGAKATAEMIASRGRAARLQERSLGHIDPGAASAALLIAIFAELVQEDP